MSGGEVTVWLDPDRVPVGALSSLILSRGSDGALTTRLPHATAMAWWERGWATRIGLPGPRVNGRAECAAMRPPENAMRNPVPRRSWR